MSLLAFHLDGVWWLMGQPRYSRERLWAPAEFPRVTVTSLHRAASARPS